MQKTSLRQDIAAVSNVTKAASYMLAAAFCFALMNSMVRLASHQLPPLEIAFFRNLFALAFMLPWLFRRGSVSLRTNQFGLHLTRAIISVFVMGTWFTALALVPLAEAVALNFTLPFFILVGAVIFLGEQVGPRRWIATGIGFLGMLVIFRPGFTELSPIMALPVIAAVLMAVSMLILKRLTVTDSAGTTVLYMNLLMTPLSLLPAILVWRSPGLESLGLLLILGLFAALAHFFLASAYVRAEASAVAVFDYIRLPLITMFAYMWFGEVPAVWTWVGAGIIVSSAIYIARREAMLARENKVKPAVVDPLREG